MRFKLFLTATAASFMATAAGAQTATYAPAGASPSAGFTVVNTFDTPAEQAAITGSNFIFQSTSNGDGVPPPTSAGSNYLSVRGTGAASYDLAAFNPRNIQFDWGSTDTYNSLTVLTTGGVTYNFAPGDAGGPVTAGSSGLFTLRLGDDRVSSVTFASSQNSFELDNFAISGGVPEPATWALMIMGFGAVGGALRRRKVATASFA